MSFPRYERYKDSGVAWLGAVPQHWCAERVKNTVISCRNGTWGDDETGDDWDLQCVRVADFDRDHLKVRPQIPTIRNVSANERKGRILRSGDLLLEKSGGGDRQPVGCVVLHHSDRPSTCSNFIARMEVASGFDSSYLCYVHFTMYALGLSTRSINQTSGIQNLDQSAYLNEVVAFPGHSEQVAIALFLDQETAKIDALIEKQRQLIALLKEKRQAVISHAVTKGLNPAAPMKDSGVDWLGMIPEAWTCARLETLCQSISTGPFGTSLNSNEYVENGVPVINPSHIVKQQLVPDSGVSVSFETSQRLSAWLLQAGDVILARRGELGRAAVVKETHSGWVCGTGSLRLRPQRERLLPSLLVAILESDLAKSYFGEASVGATMPNLNESIVGNLQIAFPPSLTAQQTFISALDERLWEVDRICKQSTDAITLLQERRSALISAAVTGKIDVRNYASPKTEVPEEVYELA